MLEAISLDGSFVRWLILIVLGLWGSQSSPSETAHVASHHFFVLVFQEGYLPTQVDLVHIIPVIGVWLSRQQESWLPGFETDSGYDRF